MTPAFWYHASVLLVTFGFVANAFLNCLTFRRPRASRVAHADSDLPFISVLVPARNEEDNIEACVRYLLGLNYPNFEVVVLDDGSSDSTYSILCRIRDQDYRLRVLIGSELPEGWYGKPHACWQLAHAAKGEYLLMTDADCTFARDALFLALGAAEEHRADVVSLVPDLAAETFWERVLIPLQYFIILGFLPTFLVRNCRHHWFAPANGAFLFLRKDTYLAIDGHRAVRNQLAEDIKFAQHVKRSGRTLWYGDGSRVYRVRMYDSLAGIWSGFSKNIFPAFSRNVALMTFILAILTVTLVLPPVFAALGILFETPWCWLAAGAYLCGLAVRLVISWKFNEKSSLEPLLFPLAWAIVIAIAINSARQSLSGAGNSWKGRTYGS